MAAENASLPNSYEGMYERAEALVRAGRPDAAAEILERIQKRLSILSEATLERNPGLADFAYRTGMGLVDLLMAEGRYDDAIQALGRLHRFAPELAPVFERQAALALTAKGDLEEALTRMTALTTAEPNRSFFWIGLAEVLMALQRNDEAADALDRAIEKAEDETLKAIGEHRRFALFRSQGRVDEAVDAWERMRAADESIASPRAHDLYDLLLDAGDSGRLRRFLRQDTSKARAEYYRGLLDHAAGDFAAGTARWEGLLKISPYEDRLGVLEWAQAALRLGRTEESMQILVASAQEGSSPRSLLLLGIGAALRGRMEQALSVIERGALLLRTSVPRAERYSFKDWELLTSLVDNRELWQALALHFDTGQEAA